LDFKKNVLRRDIIGNGKIAEGLYCRSYSVLHFVESSGLALWWLQEEKDV